jgi:hypothetical protein
MSPALPTRFEAVGNVDGQVVHWSRAPTGHGLRARTSTKDAEALRRTADALRKGGVPAVEPDRSTCRS